MANPGEYKSKIGLSNLYVAEVTQDDALAYSANTPEYLAPAAEASQEPTNSFEIQYADDQPYDVMTSEGDTKINLTVTGMSIEMLAKITGRVFDPTTGRMFDNAGVAPYFALSFRSLKSNGKYRYYQYLKGKFDMPKEETATKGEKPEPKTLQLTFTAIKTVYKFNLGGGVTDSVKRVIGDDDTTNFNGANWFNAVQVPQIGSIAALALSNSVPTNNATGVSVSANQVLTFNNALKDWATSGIVLVKSTDGSVVTTVNTLDSTKKIITVDPTSNLTASTVYILTYAVTDVYGQTLNGSIRFTTA